MKLFQKILAGVGIVALATAAGFPYVKAHVDSLPKQLTKEQAAERYLKIACPLNKIQDYRTSLSNKLNKEMNMRYDAGSDELALANNRVGELGVRIRIVDRESFKVRERDSKAYRDPKYIWPVEIQDEIKLLSETQFRLAGTISKAYEENRPLYKAEKVNVDKDFSDQVKAVSNIRLELNLPVAGKGCK